LNGLTFIDKVKSTTDFVSENKWYKQIIGENVNN
jgi:hypothetical protein